jgi:hypothetical protein
MDGVWIQRHVHSTTDSTVEARDNTDIGCCCCIEQGFVVSC